MLYLYFLKGNGLNTSVVSLNWNWFVRSAWYAARWQMIAVPRIIVFSATRPLVIIRVIILVIKIIDKINTVIIADDEWWLPLLFSTLTPYNHHHKQIHHRHCHHHFTLYVTLIIHFYQFLLANDNNSSFWAFTSPIPNTELLQLAGFQIMIGNPGHQAFLRSVSITPGPPIAQMADIGFKVVLLERLNQKWKQKHF